ncbi:hypothetical protein BFP72_12285 [Reichenbachiella sp. 5M10]|uniref:SixA phosphatase family protein n=1 Tax=Reichenbachiella sp. 5M10 TaxID=1889772 RepID=UPI000C15C35D|nr:histidine phosphatase family protein [Reichenbachiella sp. 5M10]PIB36118.1 hypothetical protein BFP72_12285 [Reichenbachiella sp. 5M10]
MSKELFLIRHAEADSENFDIKDIERPLTSDGEIVASKVGRFLKTANHQPDAIFVSSALRTRQTSGFLVEQIGFDAQNIMIVEELYEASTRILLRVINELGNNFNKVFIIAHNPGISFLAEYLTGEIIGNVAPAGIVHLKAKDDWAEFSQNTVDLIEYISPKELD